MIGGMIEKTAHYSSSGREVYTVSRLNAEARLLLESGLPMLWLEGEMSNLARPASGHMYFSLKDDRAQIRCAMFRQHNRNIRFTPRNGQHLRVRGRVSLYEARGEFQLIVEQMEDAGEGALRARLEALQAKLAAEGLFEESAKRPLRAVRQAIRVVTSPGGAAIRDVLNILGRRFPAVPVRIYPVPVQGEEAAPRIAAALDLVTRRRDCDVIILTRGGGSLEDLWAFNEEIVVRAIHACDIPLISAVGHEVDVTLSDLAADLRAPTPSGAAELAVPDAASWSVQLRQSMSRLQQLARRRIARDSEKTGWLGKRLDQRNPRRVLQQNGQTLDELDRRLQRAQRQLIETRAARLRERVAHLERLSPGATIQRRVEALSALSHRLVGSMRRRLEDSAAGHASAARALHAVSPLATLERGYAIVFDADGRALHSARGLNIGDALEVRVADGNFGVKVSRTGKKP